MNNGNGVYCPICRSAFAEFEEHGNPPRANARCSNCRSLERHRLIFLHIIQTDTLFKKTNDPIKLLHFAPERVFYNIFDRVPGIIYTACDLFPERYHYYKGNTPIEKVDITDIPFEENSFDLILCNHVLEHIPDDRKAMSELYRVMAKNGDGIFQVPLDYTREETYEDWTITSPEEREKAFGQHDHVRWYGKDYPLRLQNAGFTVFEEDYASKFSAEEFFRYGLMPTELIYHCKKTLP